MSCVCELELRTRPGEGGGGLMGGAGVVEGWRRMAAPMSCLLGVVRFLRKMVEFRKSLNIMYYSGATLEDRFFRGVCLCNVHCPINRREGETHHADRLPWQ